MDEVNDKNTEVSVQGILFNNLKFANEFDLLEECRDKLQDNFRIVDEASKAEGLKINIKKTKTMVCGRDDIKILDDTRWLAAANCMRMSRSLCIWAVC